MRLNNIGILLLGSLVWILICGCARLRILISLESPCFSLNLKCVELRKPFDEGIGGPHDLNGCSLQRPKIVSRSYIL